MHPIAAELVALLAPPACMACRAPISRGQERLCAGCARALPWLRRACPRCALPSHRGPGCPAEPAAFPRAWAPLAYEGVARDLVVALKFRAALPVADLMAAHIAANLPRDLRAALCPSAALEAAGSGPAVLVPVPAHPGRCRRRGFDPAACLASALARRLDVPLVACLARGRGARQVGASRGARRRKRLDVRVRGDPPRVALLVDDVHTTGSTLDACARALTAAGADVAAAITYARTL